MYNLTICLAGVHGLLRSYKWLRALSFVRDAYTSQSGIEAMKAIEKVFRNQQPHWVGDGFPVRSLFSHFSAGSAISPFLLLDYAGPHAFAPASSPRGVEQHPHRGFETVTIVYQGELEHRDSAGNHGAIGPGDVQWMTAASGILHEEFHSNRFTREGGTLEMVQLWVNLPATIKMSPPRYQEILANQIPSVTLEEGAGTVGVIAGDFRGTTGPAQTFTPVFLWDLRLTAGHTTEFELPEGYMAAIVVQRGAVRLNVQEAVGAVDLVLFSRSGDRISISTEEDSMILLLAGEPIDEPVAAHGPFVMNTQAEIQQAIRDYQSGRFGRLDSTA
jgi:redox-sensitive bicupin YhaK (pirin superfamily)